MKNLFKLLGIIALVTVIGFSMAACDDGSGNTHTHSYSTTWSKNATQHWHECSCGDKKDEAAHTAGNWIVDQAATATTDGSQHKECTVCGYITETGTIPVTHTHTYAATWSNDATQHWHECTANDGAKIDVANHTGDPCTVCSYSSSGTRNDGNNPLVGVWIDWEGVQNIKASADMSYSYSTSTKYNFAIQGDYEINTTRKEVTMRPDPGKGNVQVWSYELQKSLLILKSGGVEKWYTKNPETGGGFNGSKSGNILVGMWENVDNSNDCLAFNGDAEWFQAWYDYDNNLVQKNRDGKIWWNVCGEYQYDSNRKELTLRDSDGSNPAIYTVEQPRTNQIRLKEQDGSETTFERRDNL